MHKTRIWCVGETDSENFQAFARRMDPRIQEGETDTDLLLATVLTQSSLVSCSGFRHKGYLYLNDQTSADGAGEWGIVRESDMRQVESITFGWMDKAVEALIEIRKINNGEFTQDYATIPVDQLQTKEQHGTCRHCA